VPRQLLLFSRLCARRKAKRVHASAALCAAPYEQYRGTTHHVGKGAIAKLLLAPRADIVYDLTSCLGLNNGAVPTQHVWSVALRLNK
jgi:hypothetical protein